MSYYKFVAEDAHAKIYILTDQLQVVLRQATSVPYAREPNKYLCSIAGDIICPPHYYYNYCCRTPRRGTTIPDMLMGVW